ncbi:ATP-binding cassette domain-containing protein [Acetobacterium paludosum]|uniref:ATP-binding cassette domain-containing protein n=1 Tax=Acetobacterium paludosum TaxID=52693 RepID=A0A923HWW2_9FIRM|nr:dipeptide/oligopeptide/nickel ABC transporter ATP-binding protein [Acetobacterium paludosum]MBC3889082.1 ATP-binding cassette domain-containing protein [Acetobacterium paludosum]
MLQVNDLSKVYKGGFFSKDKLTAVESVSFQIKKGDCFGIIGESGSGKTTIGKIVAGLLKPTSGELYIDGKNILKNSEMKTSNFRRRVQMIFQEPDGVMDPRWKIERSMMEPLDIHFSLNRNQKIEKVNYWLETVGLTPEHLERYPFELSGGQLQRLAFARALSMEPDLIIADEPTSSLDVSVQAQILTLMKKIQKRYELTILFITHDLYVARQMCSEIAVMQNGRFVETGSAEGVFDHPQEKYTQMLIDSQLPLDFSVRKKLEYTGECYDGKFCRNYCK